MRTSLIVSSIGIFCSLFLTIVEASDKETELFPLQPAFIYSESNAFINPFEMTSFSFGKAFTRYHRDINNTFKEKGWFTHIRNHVYETKLELPIYQKYISIGFDYTFFNDKIFIPTRDLNDMDKLLALMLGGGKANETNLKPILNDGLDHNLDKNSQFSDLYFGINMLPTLKLKWPIRTKLGYFAGTITPKAGLMYIGTAKNKDTFYYTNLGYSVGISLGLDYYPTQWLGIFFEYSVKYNKMQWLHNNKNSSAEDQKQERLKLMFFEVKNRQKAPYSYTTSAFTVGFKSTF